MLLSVSFLISGDSTCGQRAIYHSLGLTGIPIINVNNNCSTGSTALFMGRQLIMGGELSFIALFSAKSLTAVAICRKVNNFQAIHQTLFDNH